MGKNIANPFIQPGLSMRMCSTQELADGMILGKPIFQMNGKLLLGAGFRICESMKGKLLERGISFVYIMEEGTEDIVPDDVISDEVRLQSAAVLAEQASQVSKQIPAQNMSKERLYESVDKGYLKNIAIGHSARLMVEEILRDISSAGDKFFNGFANKAKDTYLFDHSINTAVLSILLGRKFRLSQMELTDLALGSFLHDFGKIVINRVHPSANGAIPDELMKEHPVFGCRLLQESRDVSPVVCQIVRQHHEHQDGSGYPSGFHGENRPPIKIPRETKGIIYRLAEVCTVADVFDRIVMDPSVDRKMSPGDAMADLIRNAGTKYNKEIVTAITRIIPHYPVGAYVAVKAISEVTLTGYRGVVAKVSEDRLDRPVVVLIRDRLGRKIAPIPIDTAIFPTVELEIVI